MEASPVWRAAPSLLTPRVNCASATGGGQWFVAGGLTTESGRPLYPFVDNVEVFDFVTRTWRTLPSFPVGRTYPELIYDDRSKWLIVAGGAVTESGILRAQNISDLWDGQKWLSRKLNHARYGHGAVVADGRAVIAGGWGNQGAMLDDAEYLVLGGAAMDGAGADGWHLIGAMPGGTRVYHSMTTLSDEQHVLVAGGCEPGMVHNKVAADLLDARSGTWRPTMSMHEGRCGHRAVLLSDGRVMVSGGYDGASILDSAEIYDPASQSWMLVSPMRNARARHAMVALPDGRVLVAGGTRDPRAAESGALTSSELYDPDSDSWADSGDLSDARYMPVVALHSDHIYVGAGSNESGALASVESFDLTPEVNSCGCRTFEGRQAGRSGLWAAAIACLALVTRRRCRG